jgi:hypothetical protein
MFLELTRPEIRKNWLKSHEFICNGIFNDISPYNTFLLAFPMFLAVVQ